MKLDDLIRYNIPKTLIERWRRDQGEYFLPLQERCVRDGLLDYDNEGRAENLLISAPTSSGKSFCGELAAVVALMQRKKTIMLLPLKSIAEEKYRQFRERYEEIGIKTIISTSDHPEFDGDLEDGSFDLAVVIYEKFNRLLTANIDILQRVGLVIIDELQMISDQSRGFELEMALTKTQGSGYAPRLIGLSAVLDDSAGLAGWLGCREINETIRPIDLHQGIAAGGYFRYRSFNDGREGREKFGFNSLGGDSGETLIDYLKNDKDRKLVFLKSKKDTIAASFKLASAVGWKEASGCLRQLEGEENSFLIRSLRQTLSRGVAFHNADLTPRQRRTIEDGYRGGEIRIIFSTTTLAMGVNLPADVVLLETMKYGASGTGGRPMLAPISASEYRNITGRAGRFGLSDDNKPGKAIALAESEFEFDVLWSEYINSPRKEAGGSVIRKDRYCDMALDMIVSGLARDYDSLYAVFDRCWKFYDGAGIDLIAVVEAVEELIKCRLIKSDLSPTNAGQAVALSGITIDCFGDYSSLLESHYPKDRLGWLYLALSGSSFDRTLAGLFPVEFRQRNYERLLYRDFDHFAGEFARYARRELGEAKLDFGATAILKAVFVMDEWADNRPVEQIEQKYQLHHGQILTLAENAAWLILALSRIMRALDAGSELESYLKDLSFNVHFGVSPKVRELFLLSGGVLNRGDLRKLEENTIYHLRDMNDAGLDAIAQILDSGEKAKKLFEILDNETKEDTMQNQLHNPSSGNLALSRAVAPQAPRINDKNSKTVQIGFGPSLLEIDGSCERERYLVKVDGFSVRLTGKSFKYLAKLTSARLLDIDGWIYKDDIEAGFNQARYLYRLKQEMKKGGVDWPIFENNRLGYYRLDIDPDKIRMDIERLKLHHDYEIQELAEKLSLRLAS